MSNNHPVPALFSHLGMPTVKPSDEFTITYKNGMLEASVKRSTGKVETVTRTVGSQGFSQMTNFDPDEMNSSERNELIKKLHKNGKGEAQSSLGKKFGLTQPQISRIVRG
ncbi:MAG: hypothetical protein WC426_09165 [Sulfuriferula sp.]